MALLWIEGFEGYGVPASGSAVTAINNSLLIARGYDATATPYITTRNGSPWVTTAPEGSQVCFLQQEGTATQSITVVTAGSYILSFQAAKRPSYTGDNVAVLIDGVQVGYWASALFTSSFQLFSVGAGTPASWAGGVLAPNGMIYGIPQDNTAVLKIDPTTDLLTTFGSLAGSAKWSGGVLAVGGMIYGMPSSSTAILKIDPTTDTATTFGVTSGSWAGGIVPKSGVVYGVPYGSSSILKIGGPAIDVPIDFCLSRHFNKF